MLQPRYLVTLLILLLLTLLGKYAVFGVKDPYRCDTLLTKGRWSHNFGRHSPHTTWNPQGCMLHKYETHSLSKCLHSRKLVFIGDSMVRDIFWETAKRVDNDTANQIQMNMKKHADVTFGKDEQLSSLSFLWDPFLNETSAKSRITYAANNTLLIPYRHHEEQATVTIIGGGLWHAKHLGSLFDTAYENDVTTLVHALRSHSVSPNDEVIHDIEHRMPFILALPVVPPNTTGFDQGIGRNLSTDRIAQLNSILLNIGRNLSVGTAWSLLHMVGGHKAIHDDGHIHLKQAFVATQTDVLLNRVCNPTLAQKRFSDLVSNCCIPTPVPTYATIVLLTAAVALVVLASNMFFSVSALVSPAGLPKSLSSNRILINASAILSLTLMYLYIADRTSLFTKSAKVTHETLFSILFNIVVPVLGSLTGRKVPLVSLGEQHLLSHVQTEEWKGWMQAYILLYHYFGMSKVLWSYQIARLFVASYIFITGYGQTRSILRQEGPTWPKFVTGLVKLNLLPSLLAPLMGVPYDFYYFPALISFWFIVIQVTWIGVGTRTPGPRNVTFRITISLCLVNALVRSDEIMYAITVTLKGLLGLSINYREAVFRIALDIHVVYLGIFLAAVPTTGMAQMIQGLRRHVLPDQSPLDHIHKAIQNAVIGRYLFSRSFCVVGCLVSYTLVCIHTQDKHSYVRLHPVVSLVPVLGHALGWKLILRPDHEYRTVFGWLGRISLETFILQYHCWLAADTKGLLRLGILDHGRGTTKSNWAFWLEGLLLTVIFLWLSSAVHDAMDVVVKWILDNDSAITRPAEEGNVEAQPATTKTSDGLVQKKQSVNVRRVAVLVGFLFVLNKLR